MLLVYSLGLAGCGQSTDTSAYDRAIKVDNPPQQEWHSYLGDKGFSHYSALSQVSTDNVQQLQEVWRYDAGGAAADGSTQMQCSPLMVKGILYCTSPLLHAFAVDAATGRELWRFDPDPDNGLIPNPNRGVVYWQSPSATAAEGQRILYTAGSFLYALNARTGLPVRSFGRNGKVDLHQGLPAEYAGADVIATTPGTVAGDVLIIGSRVSEFSGAAPGHIRAFDIVTGELRWVFHTIPTAHEFGADTWPEESWGQAGGANSWAGIAVDEARGLAFVPTGSPAFDFYGADRHGDNLFANSLVALDVTTGKRVWHYQFVRHDLWDRDLPAPPNLITLQRHGKAIPAVAQATKTGHFFIFHRETGELLLPVHEAPVVGAGAPGDKPAISQPLPVAPPPFAQQVFIPTDRNATVQAAVQKRVATLRTGSQFMAPDTTGQVLYPGMDGGAEWGGAAYDSQHRRLYINSNEVPYLLQLTPVEKDMGLTPQFAYLMLCSGCHGGDRRGDGVSVPSLVQLSDRFSPLEAYDLVKQGRGRMPSFAHRPWYEIAAVLWYLYTAESDAVPVDGGSLPQGDIEYDYLNAGFERLLDPEGLPASKPPWGSLTAIDLDSAKLLWRIPLGDYPRALARGESGLGSENYGGPLVTDGGLLFIAATPDRLMKAYNKHTGQLLWQAELPAAGFASPISYAVDGRQFIVVAAGGGKLGQASGAYYVAYALPLTAPSD